MSEVDKLTQALLPRTAEPYRIAVRRLRWFRSALLHQLDALTQQTGIEYELDDRRLAAAFVAWLRRVEEQRPEDSAHRRAYFDFVAGLMLYELVCKSPVRAKDLTGDQRSSGPEHVWPEGFACAVFCINMRAAVLAQEYDETSSITSDFEDPRLWMSFHENVQEQASSAIGFLHLFVGSTPDWMTPTLFADRFNGPAALWSPAPKRSLPSTLH